MQIGTNPIDKDTDWDADDPTNRASILDDDDKDNRLDRTDDTDLNPLSNDTDADGLFDWIKHAFWLVPNDR